MPRLIVASFFLALALLSVPRAALAFAQYVPHFSCAGHEEITRQSGYMAGYDFKELKAGKDQISSKSNCRTCWSYGADSWYVYSAIIGQRWVDMMGFRGVPGTESAECLDAVAQDNDDVQYSHTLRKKCDVGREGRNRTIEGSKALIRAWFKRGLQEGRDASMTVTDGGATQQSITVSKAFFHFGRASHVFQDSFSPEHTIRNAGARGKPITDVRTFVCTPGAPVHRHDHPATGDIVPNTCNPNANPADLSQNIDIRREAVWAVNGMVDLWKAFMNKSTDEMERVLAFHMNYDPKSEPSGRAPGFAETKKCLASVQEVNVLAARREQCMKKTGRGEGSPMQPPYSWSGTYILSRGLADPRTVQSACVASYLASGGKVGDTQQAKAPQEAEHVRQGTTTVEHVQGAKLIGAAQLFPEAKRSNKAKSLKKGTAVAVKEGKKNPRKDKTFEWCQVQVGEDPPGWLLCGFLPKEFRK